MNHSIFRLEGISTEPIRRVENGSTVRYENVELLAEGVWTDQKSRTPTLYAEEGMRNLRLNFDDSKYQGPPVNIQHDMDRATGDVNPVSVGGYIDPDSLSVEDKKLFGDIVLDTDSEAGAYGDANLKRALETGGTQGFGGPSVELTTGRDDLEDIDHPQAEQKVVAADLHGVGLVRDPASRESSMSNQVAERGVALSSGSNAKVMRLQNKNMNLEELRATLEEYGLECDGMSEDEMMDMAAKLGVELEDEDYDDEDEAVEAEDEPEDEEENLAEDMDPEEVVAMVQALRERIESLEEEHEALLKDYDDKEEDEEEMQEELSALREDVKELADSKESLENDLEEKERRLSAIESEPEESKTLADVNNADDDGWLTADSSVDVDTSF